MANLLVSCYPEPLSNFRTFCGLAGRLLYLECFEAPIRISIITLLEYWTPWLFPPLIVIRKYLVPFKPIRAAKCCTLTCCVG